MFGVAQTAAMKPQTALSTNEDVVISTTNPEAVSFWLCPSLCCTRCETLHKPTFCDGHVGAQSLRKANGTSSRALCEHDSATPDLRVDHLGELIFELVVVRSAGRPRG